MLTPDIQKLIADHRAGMVATVDAGGAPRVSPKATFVILDDRTIAFGNIRSPGTLANLRRRPAVEVCFLDVLRRKAVRVTGAATIVRKTDAEPRLTAAFERDWSDYIERMSAFVVIAVSAAEMIWSPAYDMGFDEQQLRDVNLKKLSALED